MMKIGLFGVPGIPVGKHHVKDPRLDRVDALVEAKKKTYVQVELVSEKEIAEAQVILTCASGRPDLILHDLEFIEMRLGRNPQPAEQSALEKMKERLDAEQFINGLPLTTDESKAIAAYPLVTRRPVLVAAAADLSNLGRFLVGALEPSGHTCFFTVGGKENRAWLIRKGMTAGEAAGCIHSDLQKGFIRAEILSYEDLVQHGGETGAKRAGKLRLETKDYVMRDCDIANFRFSR